jgi:hypothetical protein
MLDGVVARPGWARRGKPRQGEGSTGRPTSVGCSMVSEAWCGLARLGVAGRGMAWRQHREPEATPTLDGANQTRSMSFTVYEEHRGE